MSELNIKDIMGYLPHRYPFLLVDKVLSYEAGKSIIGLKNVTLNEPFFTGHFPEQPVMPGVLMVEALAQVSGILAFLTMNSKPNPENWFYLGGIDKGRFKRVVLPGDQLYLHSEISKRRSDLIWVFLTRALVNDQIACSVELMLAKGAIK